MKTATETIQRDIIIGYIPMGGDLPQKNQDTMTANKYLKDRLPIGDPTYWTDAEVEELMESYATDRLDSYKEAQRQAIEERIQHLERLMADSETGTEDWFKIGHLISEAKRNFSILISVTPKE